jgi:cyclohexyl-isocyanide hydratase
MRWLYHLVVPGGGITSPEGFVHCSYADKVAETAKLYFDGPVEALQIDPRRITARVEIAETPRGPMPHLFGDIADEAVKRVPLGDLPDRVTGTRFGFVAFEGMTLLDLIGVHDPLARIGWMKIDETSSCEIVGWTKRVWCTDGATLEVARVRPALDFDVLVIPGGMGTRELEKDGAFLEWIATFPKNRLIATVCTGSILLAATGRLEGRRATTHQTMRDRLAELGAIVTEARVVDEGQIVTAGGVTAGLDLGIHLVRRSCGEEAARRIAKQMELV